MLNKLNTFQRAMLRWSQLHAYNAAHAVRIQGQCDQAKIRQSVADYLSYHQIAKVSVTKKHYQYSSAIDDLDLPYIAAQDQGLETLRAWFEQQINQPFPLSKAPASPFRFVIIQDKHDFYLAVAYWHFICGADNITALLQAVINDYVGTIKINQTNKRLRYSAPRFSYAKQWLRHGFAWLAYLPRHIRNAHNSLRALQTKQVQDKTNKLRFINLTATDYQLLLKTAKQWQVSINDVLLALMGQALMPHLPSRIRGHRRKLSLASIVNARQDVTNNDMNIFGLLLGAFNVTCPITENMSTETLAKAFARQTSTIKKHKLYLSVLVDLTLAEFMISTFFSDRVDTFYAKHYPIWGGITNVNINRWWQINKAPHVLDYWRTVSTGPATPLVLSITTVGQHMNVSMIYRQSVFDNTTIEHIDQRFRDSINALA